MSFVTCFLILLFGYSQAQGPPGLRFGPAYELARTSSYIIESETTLYVPKAPDLLQDLVAIWPGVNTNTSPMALVQSCIVSSKTNLYELNTFVCY
jgi:hypothetical protein